MMHAKSLRVLVIAPLVMGCIQVNGQAFANNVIYLDQGENWTGVERQLFYEQDQGSRLMPLAWMQALKLPDGSPFLGDRLARYGYLPKPDSSQPNLPVGFTLSDYEGAPTVGMTCSACHTRQIVVDGTSYRVDGGPAIVDFQKLLRDLDTAMGVVHDDRDAFAAFADTVLGPDHTLNEATALHVEVDIWYARYHAWITGSLTEPGWGPSRLDAVSMIFNRLAGLDVGEPPTYVIEENIAKADAPVRYPFLWNAALQDRTQWPGFAKNGNEILGLARNLGEVYGVFGVFHPKTNDGFRILNRDYLTNNSANFDGLRAAENLMRKLGPPRWPWYINKPLADKGKEVFEDAGCNGCHGKQIGVTRPQGWSTWKTPVKNVRTDARECSIIARVVDTGSMAGARIPFSGWAPIAEKDSVFRLLEVSVSGTIIQEFFRPRGTNVQEQGLAELLDSLDGAFTQPSQNVMPMDDTPDDRPTCAYEARVLEGIWAAAPYLHNGSVPTLEELLKPASERLATFEVGPNYDIESVGLAAEQTRFDYTLETTGCDDPASGNSRCGHEYGTMLSPEKKRALLEYLKFL